MDCHARGLVLVAVVLQNQLSFVITATLFAIFAMSWAFFTSFSGYLNLGHVIFIGLAGYTSATLNYHLGWPMWLCMVVGVVVGTGGGWLYLNPIHRRITGLSFEMVSFLSIVAMSNLIVSSYARPLTGGDIGLSPIDGFFTTMGFAVALAVIVCVAGFFFTRYLKSDSGKIIDFARENPSHRQVGRHRPSSLHRQAAPAQRPGGEHRRSPVRALLRRRRRLQHVRARPHDPHHRDGDHRRQIQPSRRRFSVRTWSSSSAWNWCSTWTPTSSS